MKGSLEKGTKDEKDFAEGEVNQPYRSEADGGCLGGGGVVGLRYRQTPLVMINAVSEN